MKYTLALLFTLTSPFSVAATTALANNTFAIDEGVAFTLGNDGAEDYLYSWTDSSGSELSIADPTLILTAGQTYTFVRTSPLHPFAILNDTLSVSVIGGSLFRDSQNSTVINASILSPEASFIANPTIGSTPANTISWTPSNADIGDYFYTCLVTSHTSMTGRIQVVPEPSSQLMVLFGLSVLVARRKR